MTTRKEGRRGQGTAFFSHAASPGEPEVTSPEQQAREMQDRARDLVQQALWAAAHDPVAQERTRGQLVRLARTDRVGGRAVGRQLAEALQSYLELAWRHGWEPADLHRVAGRGLPGGSRLTAAAQDVLVDAMAAELAGYAADLLPVLVARSRAVDEAAAEMFPDLVQRSAGRASDPEGWYRGRAVADQANLGRAESLAAGRQGSAGPLR